MKRLVRFLLLAPFALTLFSSCEKEDITLNAFVDHCRIFLVENTEAGLLLSINDLETLQAAGYQANVIIEGDGFSYHHYNATGWYGDGETFCITGCPVNTKLTATLEIENPKDKKKKANSVTFTTKALRFDYTEYYGRSAKYFAHNINELATSIFTVEGGLDTLYGEGFKAKPVVMELVDPGNLTRTPITCNVISDRMLTFKMPENLLTQLPYVLQKKYLLSVNGSYFRDSDYYKKRTATSAPFYLYNKDTYITNASYSYGNIYFEGFFANFMSGSNATPFLRGVFASPVARTVVVKKNGSVVKRINIRDTNDSAYPNDGYATAYSGSPSRSMGSSTYMLHEIGRITIKRGDLSAGSYTAFVEFTAKGGAVIKTDEVSFTCP